MKAWLVTGIRWLAVTLSATSLGCSSHGVAHVAPDESRPHFSWEIRGGEGGDATAICGSALPAKPCTLVAGGERRGSLASVHLAVHAAAVPTSYLGFMRTPFLEGSGSLTIGEINATVQPGADPAATTVTGRITSKPGTYTLAMWVDASQAGGTPQRLSQDVIVTVAQSGSPQ